MSSTIEFDLICHLLNNYSVNVRPVRSVDTPVVVYVGVVLNQLIDMVCTLSTPFYAWWTWLYNIVIVIFKGAFCMYTDV